VQPVLTLGLLRRPFLAASAEADAAAGVGIPAAAAETEPAVEEGVEGDVAEEAEFSSSRERAGDRVADEGDEVAWDWAV
jgi:hypothetical protein